MFHHLSFSDCIIHHFFQQFSEANRRLPPCFFQDRSIIRDSTLLRPVRTMTGYRKEGRGGPISFTIKRANRVSSDIHYFILPFRSNCEDRCPWLGSYHLAYLYLEASKRIARSSLSFFLISSSMYYLVRHSCSGDGRLQLHKREREDNFLVKLRA